VNAIAPGVFKTDINAALLEGASGEELLMDSDAPWRLPELASAAILLASDAAALSRGSALLSTGFLASGSINKQRLR
jgi:NAD(P)-dependent dehydrogenase (short-subunit alcohol dehydrogenase family)